MSVRVLVADDLSDGGIAVLREAGLDVEVRTALKGDALREALRGVHALVVRSATKVDAAALEGADSLRVIGRAGIGVDNVDVPAASRRGIVVMNTPSGNAVTTAEHAIALMMALARRLPQAHASVKAGRWTKTGLRGVELCGKTLGVVGLGNIGRLVVERALGLRMQAIAHDPYLPEDVAGRLGIRCVPLDELLRTADVVSLHVPLTPRTRNLLDAGALALMKPGALLINTARGGIVDEAALHDALASGRLGGAALDVFASEPPAGSPLLGLDNVVLTPHLGASTEEAQERVAVEIARQVVEFLGRGAVRNAVNMPPLPPEMRAQIEPYVELAAMLGSFVGRMCEAGLSAVEIEAEGDVLAPALRLLAAEAVASLLRGHVEGPVNAVNAAMLAADRGIRVAEIRKAGGTERGAAVAVAAYGGTWSRRVRGAVVRVGGAVEKCLVEIDGVRIEAGLSPHMLLIRNDNRPGVIGAIGTVLGDRAVNVAGLRVGTLPGGAEAIQVWSLDAAAPDDALESMRALPGVLSAVGVAL